MNETEAPAATEAPHTAAPAGAEKLDKELSAQAHTEVAAEEHSAGFPPFDPATFGSQILWLAITFGVLYLLMRSLVIPRIGGILENRAARIASDLGEANRLKEQSDVAIANYEKALAEARSEANRIAAESTEAAKASAAAERKSTEESLAQKLAAGEARIAEIKAKALADVGTIASEATDAVVSALSGQKATGEELSAAVSAALKK